MAKIDRLVYRACILSLAGPSLRYEEAMREKHLTG